MRNATQQVLLVGASAEDAQRVHEVLRASDPRFEVVALADAPALTARLAAGGPVRCVLVSTAAPLSARGWRRQLEAARVELPLIAFGDALPMSHLMRWLAEGGTDALCREHVTALPGLLARLEREQAEALAHETMEQRWREGTASLVRLARDPAFTSSDHSRAFALITEAAVRSLQVSRASIWLLPTGDATEAVRAGCFDGRTQSHPPVRKLPLDEHGRRWFDGLRDQRSAILDTRSEPMEHCFLARNAGTDVITAGIVVAVRRRGTMAGALCVEHLDTPRTWHAGEESFTQALADLTSLALESGERHRAEVALTDSERRFHDLFRYSNDSIVLYRVREDGRVECEDINPAAEKLSGLKREATVGKTAAEVLSGPAVKIFEGRWAQAIRARTPVVYEQEYPLPAGRRWVSTSMVPMIDEAGAVHRLAAISRDVTQDREAELLQRSLEQQLAESQKSDALARLASHIAHDVNNLLTVIVAHAQRLQGGQAGKTQEVAQAILEATARGRELTQQVLTFGRRRPPERKPVELQPLIRETLRLVEPTARGVTLREVLAPRVPRVMGDAGQLHQVLTNLCTNALHAMQGEPRVLTVALEQVDVDFAFAQRHPPLQEGKWVRLSVSDTGVGMDEATQRRVFEPFFSAREDGGGTGLGLAVVQSIVQGHDGTVLVESRPGAGSTFHVYLPQMQEDLSRPGNGQHLMLVDDHPGMARVSARLLETLGYRTTVFDDPREALAAVRAAPRGFDAVLTDLSMPQMSGEEFTRQLRDVRPDIPVIVSSGMATELDDETLQRLRIDALLVKPWRLEEAVSALKRVLG